MFSSLCVGGFETQAHIPNDNKLKKHGEKNLVLCNSHPPIDSDIMANQDLTRIIVEFGKVRLLQIATAWSFKLF